MTIYLLINTETAKVYVGQTIGSARGRWLRHVSEALNPQRKGCRYLSRAIRKHGSLAFILVTLERCQSIDQLNEREAWWIERLRSMAPNGYNLRAGGLNGCRSVLSRLFVSGRRNHRFGKTNSAETRAKISANRKPPVLTPELSAKLSAASRRRKSYAISEETKLKMSLAAKGKPKPWKKGKPLSEATRLGFKKYCETGGLSGANNPMFGKTHGASARRKISEAHKGKPCHWLAGKPMHPNAARALKLARVKQTGANSPMFGRRHSEETKRKISANRKPFVLTPEISAIKSAAMKLVWEKKRKEANAATNPA